MYTNLRERLTMTPPSLLGGLILVGALIFVPRPSLSSH